MVLRRRLVATLVVVVVGACSKAPTTPATEAPEGAGSKGASSSDAPSRDHAEPGEPPATAEPEATANEELDIDGVHLSLSSGCDLVATFGDQRREHHFDFPGECHFAPDPQDRPAWVVPTDNGKAVLVVGSAPTDGSDCDTALQVLVVTEKGPALSVDIQRVAGCGPGPWDEMMYHVMSSRHALLGGS